MIVRNAMIGAALGLCLLAASGVRAEEPEDKSVVDKARQEAQSKLRDAREAEQSARQKLREAEQRLKSAERELKIAAADAKQAAEAAVSDAKQALERAKLEATAAGTTTIQTIRDLKNVGKERLEATLDTASAAKDQAADKAAELKGEVAEAAARARNEAEGAAQQADTTVRQLGAKAHEIMREAVGATGEGAQRRQARRMAWRQLSSRAERPQDVTPSVREELRRHAQRVARLRRIRVLATEKQEPALVERTDKLLARENGRHEKKLAVLWSVQEAKQRAKVGEDDEQDPAEEQAEEEEEQQP